MFISVKRHEREKQELNSLTETLRIVAFYNAWTRKEAYLKATGEGLVDALSGIEVAISPLAPAGLQRAQAAGSASL